MQKHDKNLLRVAIYIRVSSNQQAAEGDSMRDQLESCQDYIKKHDNMICCGTYVDGGISGQKLHREDFDRLMDDVQAGNVDLIIFTKLDRWFRSLRHYLNTQDLLEKHDVAWTAISQPYFDTSTAHGRAFVAQSMTWAELEAQMDSERILSVFSNKVKNGEVISGTVPLGYRIQGKHLVPSEQAPVIRALFDHYLHHQNLTQAMLMLREEYGIIRTSSTVRKILKREIYLGKYRENDHYCEPLVDQETFDTVQRYLSMNRKTSQKHDYIFSRLVRCAECGTAMSAHQITVHGHRKPNGSHATYHHSAYRCKKRYDSKLCDNKKIIYESVLERYMLDHLNDNISAYIAEYEAQAAPLKRTVSKRTAIEHKMEKLKELYINDLITLEELSLIHI